ncbi:hypothetical protein O1611_g7230 [Lasiodiplodia mahajangana]|uniref:Uncharacterized protein n=1 Tax=Lasiodiplodia mahajangana TaxID=1108764 RepID=A0ACC2JGA1_9PEZI|nr:hypothetical protein O1611_g7230 [Lasiodiplodia mahajangana]
MRETCPGLAQKCALAPRPPAFASRGLIPPEQTRLGTGKPQLKKGLGRASGHTTLGEERPAEVLGRIAAQLALGVENWGIPLPRPHLSLPPDQCVRNRTENRNHLGQMLCTAVWLRAA